MTHYSPDVSEKRQRAIDRLKTGDRVVVVTGSGEFWYTGTFVTAPESGFGFVVEPDDPTIRDINAHGAESPSPVQIWPADVYRPKNCDESLALSEEGRYLLRTRHTFPDEGRFSAAWEEARELMHSVSACTGPAFDEEVPNDADATS